MSSQDSIRGSCINEAAYSLFQCTALRVCLLNFIDPRIESGDDTVRQSGMTQLGSPRDDKKKKANKGWLVVANERAGQERQ